MVDIVNVVGAGMLGVELNLQQLADDITGGEARYDPDNYPGLYLRFSEDEPLITVYRTGKFIVSGATSEEEAHRTSGRLVRLFREMGVVDGDIDSGFSVHNYVCTGDLGEDVNLNAVAIGLGLERAEYEPEQFPGLVYRPESEDCVILIFATGRVVVTGAMSVEMVERAFDGLQEALSDFSM